MTKEFIINEKYLDAMSIALNDDVYLLANEGTIRAQKTVAMIQAFFEAVQDSDEKLHLISAENLDAIRDNILQSDFGLEKVYGSYIKRVREEFGGYYLKVKCDLPDKPKVKKILLCGFSNASQWKKINGKTIGCILVDEVNMADEQFIRETFARQASVKYPKTFWTLNGDVPSHWVYTGFINRCKIIYRQTTPASIIADMDKCKKEPKWYYIHWNMDDNPALSSEQKERTRRLFPVGSYYHTIKVLGERGAPGKLIYIDYLNRDKNIKEIDTRRYNHFGIGVDIGAKRAKNSFALVGLNQLYTECGIIDKWDFLQVGYDAKKEKLIAFVRLWLSRGLNIEYISIDSAEQNFIEDIQALFKRLGLPPVIPSYKATIKERIDMGIVLQASGRMIFNNTKEGISCYDAFAVCKWAEGKEGLEREDKNEPHNDIIDSIEYALTRHMHALMKAAKNIPQKEVA